MQSNRTDKISVVQCDGISMSVNVEGNQVKLPQYLIST